MTCRTDRFREAVLHRQSGPPIAKPRPVSEFGQLSLEIGREIKNTTSKLDKLAQLVRKKSLFDEPTMEISDLTYIVKQDLFTLNENITRLGELQQQKREQWDNKHSQANNKQVVNLLKAKCAAVKESFEDVIVTRHDIMQKKKDRRELYTSSPVAKKKGKSSLFTKAQPRPRSSDAVLDMGDSPAQPAGQAMVLTQEEMLGVQADQVEDLENALEQVSQMFGNFANILAAQRDLITRIDDDVNEADANVQMAEREIFKYLTSVTSNRGLILKLFAVLVVFIVVFVVFVA